MVLIQRWTIARASHLNIALDARSHLQRLVLRLFDDARRAREDPWYSAASEATKERASFRR